MKLKSDRAMNYNHSTPNGVAMHSMAPQSIALRSNIMSTRFRRRIYTMVYAPVSAKFDGSFQYVRAPITPKDKRKVKLFAPSGYYAVDPKKIREEYFNDR